MRQWLLIVVDHFSSDIQYPYSITIWNIILGDYFAFEMILLTPKKRHFWKIPFKRTSANFIEEKCFDVLKTFAYIC